MKIISNTRRLIMRYAQITGSLIWYGALEREIQRKLRYKKQSPYKLAFLYPTEQDFKLRKNVPISDAYNTSRTYWYRIRCGQIPAPEGPFTQRIDDDFPHLRRFRQNPLCTLLGDPFGYSYSFNHLVADVEPRLNGKLIFVDRSLGLLDIQHKRLKWNHKNCRLVESSEALALKMALYTQGKSWPFGHHLPIEIQLNELILHLLRIISRDPWKYASERIIRLFWIFILISKKNVSAEQIEYALLYQDTDTIFRNIYQLLYSESCSTQQEPPTLDQYLQINQLLINNVWNACVSSNNNHPPSSRFSLETLFLADTFADVWLTQTTPKDQLFQKYPPFHEKLHKCCFQRSRHRIW